MGKIENNSGYIFDSATNGLRNELSRLHRIQELEGIVTQPLQDEIIEKLRTLDTLTTEQKLGYLRKALKDI